MVIELKGVEFVNKGAELMLYAILEQVREEYPKAIIVMERGKRKPKNKLDELQIYSKLNQRKFGVSLAKVAALFPNFLIHQFKFVTENEIDVILDASGFSFGDQWGLDYGKKRLNRILSAKKISSKKVILLPQALGPFKEEGMEELMGEVIDNSNLIFARENQSLKYILKIKNLDKIKKAPDFTNLIKGYLPSNYKLNEKSVAIIPNFKISKHLDEKNYLNYLKFCAEKVKSHGLEPFFLIHEGRRDLSIAEKTNELLGQRLEILEPEHPLVIKGIISKCRFTLSSRFHGVVSSLSQGVPCLITSWSHKYRLLARDYNVEDYVINDLKNFKSINVLIENLSNDDNLEEMRDNLNSKSNLFKIETREMWKTVWKNLET